MSSIVSVLECDPDLAEDLNDDDLAIARAQLVADIRCYPRGPWIVGPDDLGQAANLGLLLVEGLLARWVTIGDHTSAELLGPGDVLQPWLRIGPDQSVAMEVGWEVVQPVQAAVLDRGFCVLATRWPEITAAISRRIMQRTHWLAFDLAACNLRRLEHSSGPPHRSTTSPLAATVEVAPARATVGRAARIARGRSSRRRPEKDEAGDA